MNKPMTTAGWVLAAAALLAAPAWAGDDFIADLEGGWASEENHTPMGPMGMAMLFERTADGGLHAHSALNTVTYIDIQFHRAEDGRWLLTETASMEGLGVQSYTLEPVAEGAPEGYRRWAYAKDPEFLTMDVAVDEATMVMQVWLRGENHVRFEMDRLPAEALPELKLELEKQARQTPEEGTSIHDLFAEGHVAHEAPASDPIESARAAAKADPEDAQAHLALAKLLGQAINEEPANGPRYAFEMLQALQKTVELDPANTEGWQWLAGYYLSAPPIAGGSIERAEEAARKVAELDPSSGEALLAQVAAKKEQPANPAGAHR